MLILKKDVESGFAITKVINIKTSSCFRKGNNRQLSIKIRQDSES